MCCKLEMGYTTQCIAERNYNEEFLMCLVSIGVIKEEEFQDHLDFFLEQQIWITYYVWQVDVNSISPHRVEYEYKEIVMLNLTESDWKYTRGLISK